MIAGNNLEQMGSEEVDDDLMLRVAKRDGEAFRILVDRHADVAFRIGCRIVGDSIEAEDIAQETLLRLWNNADKWIPGGSGVAAWLSRVATNLCLDRLRKKKRTSEEDVPDEADKAPLADELIDEDRQGEAVKKCIGKLGDRQKAAVVLTYYEEQPNLEAAKMLKMKIKAFESLLYRARGSLKDCLENNPIIRSARGGIDNG
ncbi:hypothetical protein MNBD_ALPHA04-1776 [hydrothermal vent metagenome]|uniref:RNA polymerase ECF-type sigma factor n=1 Tax=hydrothermal vent metagenome TaxID=652676 RepID=A0A3B0S207_9ZZZZ